MHRCDVILPWYQMLTDRTKCELLCAARALSIETIDKLSKYVINGFTLRNLYWNTFHDFVVCSLSFSWYASIQSGTTLWWPSLVLSGTPKVLGRPWPLLSSSPLTLLYFVLCGLSEFFLVRFYTVRYDAMHGHLRCCQGLQKFLRRPRTGSFVHRLYTLWYYPDIENKTQCNWSYEQVANVW